MALLPIVQGVNNQILRTVSSPVKKIEKTTLKLLEKMTPTMHTAQGVGLAAPQVGENIRLFVMKLYRDNGEKYSIVQMINPEIVWKSEKMIDDSEGCLSVPGVFGIVSRHAAVTVNYTDLKGTACSLTLKDLNARIVQHETDHLDGILCVDKMTEILEPKSFKK